MRLAITSKEMHRPDCSDELAVFLICVWRLTRIGVLPINPVVAPIRSDRCASAYDLLDFRSAVSIFGWPRDGEVPEWLKGTDCKSVGFAYVGSNPTLSTNDLAELQEKQSQALTRM